MLQSVGTSIDITEASSSRPIFAYTQWRAKASDEVKEEKEGDSADSLGAYEIDEIEIPDCSAEEIDLEHCRIKCISKLERFPNVKNLCLRNNLITKLENLEPVAKTLKELDVYDNQITKVRQII
ncbi:unnamed protein product [Calicophoron daubneyi]|uniref:Uncharacterized protein n=1 Tax=Calicophoron daubneyi TaxID=300641 RepID=A0AAV2TQF0_CALDB